MNVLGYTNRFKGIQTRDKQCIVDESKAEKGRTDR